MILAITALLAVLTFGFVGYPLLRPRRAEPAVNAVADELEELVVKRDETLAAIKELEFDYESGSLSEEDYKAMEERYRERAIATLRDIDQWQAGETAGDAIERQVTALRRATGPSEDTGTADEIERRVQELRQARRASQTPETEAAAAFCHNCGAALREGARFCPSCGTALAEGHCAQCGALLKLEDRFCVQCGTPAPGVS